MKTLNSIKFLGLFVASALAFTSCSDDNSPGQQPIPDLAILFASNNANGNITFYDLSDRSNITNGSFLTPSTAADGIYYDANTDVLVQASRSGNSLEGYLNIGLQPNNAQIEPGIFGTADMDSPRELAVNGDFFVVADNADADGDTNTADGRFFVYERTGNTFTLRNTITTDFKVWGITFINDDLYAVVDADNELAVFTDFLIDNITDANVSASKRVVVEGIVRTHGLTYDSGSDTMVMTDIGDAANTQDDGGIHVITGFSGKFNALADGETLAAADQTRISGTSTFLGNPVDVAYDGETGTVYVAEAGNAGGRILAFEGFGNGGDIAPFISNALASASSVYLYKQ